MTAREEAELKPAVSITTSSRILQDAEVLKLITAVKAGLEEESVPWSELSEKGFFSGAELALRGARRSQLRVGIGIGTDYAMAVCFYHGDNNQPLFFVPGQQVSEFVARLLGTNAARLVKKIPFKELSVLTG